MLWKGKRRMIPIRIFIADQQHDRAVKRYLQAGIDTSISRRAVWKSAAVRLRTRRHYSYNEMARYRLN